MRVSALAEGLLRVRENEIVQIGTVVLLLFRHKTDKALHTVSLLSLWRSYQYMRPQPSYARENGRRIPGGEGLTEASLCGILYKRFEVQNGVPNVPEWRNWQTPGT